MASLEVDIDLSDFEIDDLIKEVESSGYVVLDEDEISGSFLSRDELDYLIELTSSAEVGSCGYFANQKLREYRNRPK